MSPKFGKYYLEADFATLKNAGKNKVQDNKDGGAGNTMPEITAIILTPVYPRWRGEHDTTPASSPTYDRTWHSPSPSSADQNRAPAPFP